MGRGYQIKSTKNDSSVRIIRILEYGTHEMNVPLATNLYELSITASKLFMEFLTYQLAKLRLFIYYDDDATTCMYVDDVYTYYDDVYSYFDDFYTQSAYGDDVQASVDDAYMYVDRFDLCNTRRQLCP